MDRNIWLDGMMGLIVGDAYNIPTGTWSDDGSMALATLGLCGAFVIGYVLLSMLPVIAVVPCVAGVIMFSALCWALVDGSGRGDNSNSNPYPISQK